MREFTGQQLIDWGLHEWGECEHVLHDRGHRMSRFECELEIIFKAPDDCKLYCLPFKYSDGSGYNSISGVDLCFGKPEPAFDKITLHEVRAVKRLVEVTNYEKVSDSHD